MWLMMRWCALVLSLWLPVMAAAQDTAAEREDRGYLTAFLEDNLSGAGRKVTVTGFSGALSSRATIEELTIADDDGIWLTLRQVELDWNRAALLSGRVQVNALTAAEIIVARPPNAGNEAPSPEATPFALPELPVSVEIGRLAANRLELGAPVLGTALTARLEAVLVLSAGQGGGTLKLERTDDGPAGSAVLNISYANDTRVLVLDLKAAEAAGGIATTLIGLPGAPAVNLAITGTGPIDNYRADIQLATDGVERLGGAVTLRTAPNGEQSFVADLGGDVAPLFLPDYAEFFGTDVRLNTEGKRDASGQLDLSRLSLVTRALTLDGSLLLGADGVPHRVALSGRIALADGEAVLLPLTTDQQTRIGSADISVLYNVAEGEGWRGTASITALDRADFAADIFELKGSGRIRPLPGAAQVGATLDFVAQGLQPADPALATALGTDVTGRATLFWQQGGDGFRFPRLQLQGDGYTADLAGRLGDLDGGLQVTGKVSAQVDEIARLAGLAGRPLAGAARLSLAGSAGLLSGAFDIEAEIAGQNLAIGQAEADNILKGASEIRLSAQRNETGTLLRNLELTAGSLRAVAAGTVASTGSDIGADVDFTDLSVLGPQYGGALSAMMRFTGTPDAGTVTLDGTSNRLAIGIAEVDNLMRGAARIRLEAGLANETVNLRQLEVNAATLDLTASGVLAMAGSDLAADLSFPDLAVLGNGYGGALQAKATFLGTPDDGLVTLSGDADGLSMGVPEVDNLLRGPSRIRLEAAIAGDSIDLRQLQVNAATLSLAAAGTLAAAGSEIGADLAFSDLRSLGGQYRGALRATARFTGTPEAGRLTAEAEANGLAIGQPEADRLLAGRSTILAELALDGGRIKVEQARLTNPQITAEATGSVNGERRDVALQARLANLGLLVPEFPGALTLNGSAQDDGNGYSLDFTVQGPGQIDLRANGRMAQDFSSADMAITGTSQAEIGNAFIAPRTVSGPLRFDLRVNGPLGLNALSGRISLTGARIADPALGMAFQGVTATTILSDGRAAIDMTAQPSDGGQIAVAGTVGMSAPFDASVDVRLTGVILRDPSLFTTRIFGALTLAGPLTAGGRITGALDLTETELRIPSTGLGSAGEIADLQHVGESADVRATRQRAGLIAGPGEGSGSPVRPLGIDITISAPNRLFVRGRGLDAELGGSLRLTGTTAAIVPIGAFNLERGRLDILGKRLDLTEALLQLEGDFVPFMRVIASNESDGVISSVVVEGRATEPDVSFTSSPELPEEEVLSRLLFGRELMQLSALQAAQLAAAVATLAGRGGEGIVGRLRQGFGLDDLDLATDAEGETSLRAGKYISRNAYTEVIVDQQGQSTINLNLDLSPSVTLRGSTGTEGNTGIGIFIEKDY